MSCAVPPPYVCRSSSERLSLAAFSVARLSCRLPRTRTPWPVHMDPTFTYTSYLKTQQSFPSFLFPLSISNYSLLLFPYCPITYLSCLYLISAAGRQQAPTQYKIYNYNNIRPLHCLLPLHEPSLCARDPYAHRPLSLPRPRQLQH
jgi:hypothetical protein